MTGSGGDATYSAFYGTNGANEIPSQTDINITQYDDGGTLTAMTAGYYRSDTVLITSDNRVSVIFGTEEFATRALAEATTGVRGRLIPAQCVALKRDAFPIDTDPGHEGRAMGPLAHRAVTMRTPVGWARDAETHRPAEAGALEVFGVRQRRGPQSLKLISWKR